MKRIRQWLAARRLEKLVKQRQASFECEQYRRRRAAALKGTGRTPRISVLGGC